MEAVTRIVKGVYVGQPKTEGPITVVLRPSGGVNEDRYDVEVTYYRPAFKRKVDLTKGKSKITMADGWEAL